MEGQGLGNFFVTITQADGHAYQGVVTIENGFFSVEIDPRDLAETRDWGVVVNAQNGYEPYSRAIYIVPGGQNWVDIVLSRRP